MNSIILTFILMASLALSQLVDEFVTQTEVDISTVTATAGGGPQIGEGCQYWPAIGNPPPPIPGATLSTTYNFNQSNAISTTLFPTSLYGVSTTAPTMQTSSASTAGSVGAGGAVPSSVSGVPTYSQAVLDQHNNHRANHSAPSLVWDDNMASIAQQIGQSCVYTHNT